MQGIADWSWSSFKAVRPDWIRDKKVTMLMQGALQNDPELKGLPNALDFIKSPSDRQVMELHFTQKTAARPVIVPPGVPAERLAMLRRRSRRSGRTRNSWPRRPRARSSSTSCPGQEVDKVVALIVATPPEHRRALRQGVRAGAVARALECNGRRADRPTAVRRHARNRNQFDAKQ